MRFAITATDRYLGVFDAFIAAGWQPLKLFTVPIKSRLCHQQAVMAVAERHGAAIQLSRMTARDLADLKTQDCDVLIVAGYDWKVVDWRPFLPFAVNFHCSPLPEGRGAYPVMRALLEGRVSWGVTCHKLTQKFDQGAILLAEHFPLQADECHESLDLKIQMSAKRIASRVAEDFCALWRAATPQGGGSYWQVTQKNESVIDFARPLEVILRTVRAFGTTGSLANVSGRWLTVKRAIGWQERHDYEPGQVAHMYNCTVRRHRFT
jgi:methionyl-tRNA formyltransferase